MSPAGVTPFGRTKGKGSDTEQYRADLKALGAYRLRKKFGVKAEDIPSLSKPPLFKEATRVTKAVKRARERIEGFEKIATRRGYHR